MPSISPIFEPPSELELKSRLERVRELMSERDLDYYVAFSPDNVFYLTNFANFIHERPFVLVVGRSGAPRFVVPKLEIPHVRTRAVGELDLVPYAEFPAPAGSTWADRLRPLIPPGARVGLESVCPLFGVQAIPGETVLSDVIDDARMIKTPYEMGRIAYGCLLISETMNKMLTGAKPGQPMIQFYGAASSAMMARILRDNPRTNMLATRTTAVFQPPSVSHDPHNFTDLNMAFEEGGPHVVVFNCVINGYGAEIERTVFLGQVPAPARRPFETMMEARRLAIELTVPGNLMGEVDRRVNRVFEKAGYADCLLHRTGHGIGVTGHEGPFLADGDERTIEPGMCFTIEPGVYLPGVGGFRHSDTVITTENGNLVLTSGPVDLAEVTLAQVTPDAVTPDAVNRAAG
jgi:Xaa-Pro dipeptidase